MEQHVRDQADWGLAAAAQSGARGLAVYETAMQILCDRQGYEADAADYARECGDETEQLRHAYWAAVYSRAKFVVAKAERGYIGDVLELTAKLLQV